MIYLLRHGLDDESFVGGWSDVSLTKEGIMQVEKATEFLKEANLDIERIICSDVKRAKQTADIVNDTLNLPITYNSILRELNKGDLNGIPKTTLMSDYPEFSEDVSIDKTYPNGESMTIFFERIKSSLEEILSYDNSLLITHRGVINMIYFTLTNTALSNNKTLFNVDHASIHELDPIKKTIKRIY